MQGSVPFNLGRAVSRTRQQPPVPAPAVVAANPLPAPAPPPAPAVVTANPAVAVPVPAKPGKTEFTSDIVTNIQAGIGSDGFSIEYAVYENFLKPSLLFHYGEAESAPPKSEKKEEDKSSNRSEMDVEVKRIKAYFNSDETRLPPNWNNRQGKDKMNNLINAAVKDGAVKIVAEQIPFRVEIYRSAILGYLNNNVNVPGFRFAGVGQ